MCFVFILDVVQICVTLSILFESTHNEFRIINLTNSNLLGITDSILKSVMGALSSLSELLRLWTPFSFAQVPSGPLGFLVKKTSPTQHYSLFGTRLASYRSLSVVSETSAPGRTFAFNLFLVSYQEIPARNKFTLVVETNTAAKKIMCGHTLRLVIWRLPSWQRSKVFKWHWHRIWDGGWVYIQWCGGQKYSLSKPLLQLVIRDWLWFWLHCEYLWRFYLWLYLHASRRCEWIWDSALLL